MGLIARSVEKAARALSRRRPEDIGKTDRRRTIQENRLLVKGTRVPVERMLKRIERASHEFPRFALDKPSRWSG